MRWPDCQVLLQKNLTEAEDLWRQLNPHPEGSYAWYGWSMEFTIDNGQVLVKPD
jgi:hypothetical protein